MNAIIKIGNLQYLKVLEQLLFSKVEVRQEKSCLVKLPFFNFVEQVIQIYQEYAKSSRDDSLQAFILTYFVRKHASPFEIYRHMLGFITMWKKYVECHEQARLLLSILSSQRSGKEGVKLFFKIRKCILKNIHAKIMQEIQLVHEDIIAISHTIFSPEMRTYSAKKIHELFISLRRKSSFSDKLNGAVVCEFFLNCAEKFQKQELQHIRVYYDNAPQQEQQVHKEILKGRTFKPLDMSIIQPNSSIPHPTKQPSLFLQSAIQREQQLQPLHQLRSKRQPNPACSSFLINNIVNKPVYRPNDPLQSAKAIVSKKYSNSWQKLLQTNRQMKQKLLRNHQQNL